MVVAIIEADGIAEVFAVDAETALDCKSTAQQQGRDGCDLAERCA